MNTTPEDMAYRHAERLGKSLRGSALNLDEGVPMDIYQVFNHCVGREYDHRNHQDELLILDLVRTVEIAHANNEYNEK